jgi:hypothetical protein
MAVPPSRKSSSGAPVYVTSAGGAVDVDGACVIGAGPAMRPARGRARLADPELRRLLSLRAVSRS